MEKKRSPWAWIPTLYIAEGLPYVAVMTISVIMYKRLGISNTDIALYTGWLYLPWVIKPFWSPFVDLVKTKRWWTVTMQLLMAVGFAAIALTLPTSLAFQLSLAAFWLVAFTSATHDIAADGYYMHALDSHEQSLYVGIRSTFYRIATVAGQGLLVILAGFLEDSTDNIPLSWTVTMAILSGLMLAASLYHQFILPHPDSDQPKEGVTAQNILREFLETFRTFFIKPGALVLTFNEDGTCTETLNGKTMKGKWQVKDSKLILTLGGIKALQITTQIDGKDMQFVTDATKLLKLFKSVGAKSTNKNIQTVTSLMKGIDGMQAGVSLRKQ